MIPGLFQEVDFEVEVPVTDPPKGFTKRFGPFAVAGR